MSTLWIISFLFLCLLLSALLIFLSFLLGQKNPYRSKISSYECGFAAIYQPVFPFTIRFFTIGVIFLIFDLEIIYLIPWSYSSSMITLQSQLTITFFVIFVVIGLIYEWVKGGLEWL